MFITGPPPAGGGSALPGCGGRVPAGGAAADAGRPPRNAAGGPAPGRGPVSAASPRASGVSAGTSSQPGLGWPGCLSRRPDPRTTGNAAGRGASRTGRIAAHGRAQPPRRPVNRNRYGGHRRNHGGRGNDGRGSGQPRAGRSPACPAGSVRIGWLPCRCAGHSPGAGHRHISCRRSGCTSTRYSPSHGREAAWPDALSFRYRATPDADAGPSFRLIQPRPGYMRPGAGRPGRG